MTAAATLSGERLWKATLGELELQMTKATFNTWLRDTKLLDDSPGRMVIGVRNEYAQDWLSQRLNDTIQRTLAAIAGEPVTIEFEIVPSDPMATAAAPSSPSPPELDKLPPHHPLLAYQDGNDPAPSGLVFAGFDSPESNWTSTPDSFFTVVAREKDGSITKIVAQTIYNTWGQFEDKRRQHRVWDWPVTITVLAEACGLSRTSVYVALWDCRAKGYLIMRPLEDEQEIVEKQERYGYKPTMTLRLRQHGDPIDTPDEPRPNYGAGRQRKGDKK